MDFIIINNEDKINNENIEVAIGICLWNAAKYIEKSLKNLELLISLFYNYIIIFYYDKSDDNTLLILNKYLSKKNKDNYILLKGEKQYSQKYRTINIANARNNILKAIYSLNNLPEYFIMYDFNYINELNFNSSVLNYYLDKENPLNKKWDSLSFNLKYYYDIWALSLPPFVLSCLHWSNRDLTIKIMRKFVSEKLSLLNEDQILPCISAFNGFAIYKSKKFINCYYSGILNTNPLIKFGFNLNNNIKLIQSLSKPYKSCFSNIYQGKKASIGICDCEHRYFHLNAISNNNSKIYISPKFLFL